MYARVSEAYRVPPITSGFPENITCNAPRSTSYECSSVKTGPCQSIGNNICCSAGSSSDFNTQYKVNKLPPYQPYPTLHPINGPNEDLDLNLDPHQGAGWVQQRRLCTNSSSSEISSDGSSENVSELLHRVLANKYCRKILQQIFTTGSEQIGGKTEDELDPNGIGRTTKANKTPKSNFDSDTIKMIIMYCLGGLILLCLFDLLIKVGQLLRH